MSLRRMVTIMRKELLHIVRDARNFFLVTVSPAFLLFLLAYIFSFDVGQLSLAVMDLDRSGLSRRYLESLTSDQDLVVRYVVDRYDEIQPLLTAGRVDVALVIPPGFAEAIQAGEPVPVQAIVDGTDPFNGRAAIASLQARSSSFILSRQGQGHLRQGTPVEVRSEAWYNAGLESLLSMVPGLMSIVLIMPALALALALTRGKESGTLEGLMGTPVSGLEYLLGKLLAYTSTGLISTILALLVATLWFQVPFRGNLTAYLLLTVCYFLACMGASVVIAGLVKSQQSAMFVVLIVFIVPSFFLAGLINPVNTSSWLAMVVSYALPSTHFVEISRAVFLKGLGPGTLLRPALSLLGMGLGALLIGLKLFNKKVS
jgi:ABC-2 type transport system permease protein